MTEVFTMDSSLLSDITEQFLSTNNEEAVMEYKDNKWLMKSQSEDNVLFAGCMVTEDGMKRYQKPDHGDMGIRLGPMKKWLAGVKGNVTISSVNRQGSNKMRLEDGSGKKLTIPYTDPQYVNGRIDNIPSMDYGVSFTIETDRFKDFINDSYSIIDASCFYISTAEGLLILYSARDQYENEDVIHAEDLHSFSVDWDKCMSPNENPKIPSGAKIPSEDKRTDSILSIDFARSLSFYTDRIKVVCDNHAPVKFVMDFEDDSKYDNIPSGAVKASYIAAPRISEKVDQTTIPDEVIPEREVLDA